MDLKQKKALTLVEVLMVIAIISILAVGGAYLMIYLLQNEVFIPNQMNMNMLASDALDIMIEGDNQAKGLRFSGKITAIDPYRIDFTNQSAVPQAIYYRLDTGANQLKRKIGAAGEAAFPYYGTASGISVTGKSGQLFTYYDASDNLITIFDAAHAALVRRIAMTLIAKTGTGAYANWQGQSEQSSSVAVKKFQ
jgi:prepilin-type N-terminal cleavage/methylation domain-containing protein